MPTYVALLRGINVGKAKRISMDDLRQVLEDVGFENVRTLLNSGNVVFEADENSPRALGGKIENAIESTLKVTSRVTVLTADELADIVRQNPLADATKEPSRFLLAVLRDPADRAKLLSAAKQDFGRERLAVGGRVAYMYCAGGILESAAAAAVNKALKDGVTARNWATMTRLLTMAGGNA